MTHSEDYKKTVESYCQNPSEPRRWPIWLAIVILASVVLAVILGCTDGWPTALRAITCWEVIAIFNTLIFSVFYFKDLWCEATPERWQGYRGTILIGVGFILNVVFLLLAFGALLNCDRLHHENAMVHQGEGDDGKNGQGGDGKDIEVENQEKRADDGSYVWGFPKYLTFVFLSFLVFAGLDLLFAFQSRVFRKVREYWLLCLFVDGPAVVAFVILLAYLLILNSCGRTVNTDILSGAVVMQMLIADTLYLVVASNLFHNLLANTLCNGVNQVGEPEE